MEMFIFLVNLREIVVHLRDIKNLPDVFLSGICLAISDFNPVHVTNAIYWFCE